MKQLNDGFGFLQLGDRKKLFLNLDDRLFWNTDLLVILVELVPGLLDENVGTHTFRFLSFLGNPKQHTEFYEFHPEAKRTLDAKPS